MKNLLLARSIALAPVVLIVAVTTSAAQQLTPVRKWAFADNQASVYLDRTYAGGVLQTFDDYIGAQDATLTGVPNAPFRFDAYCIDAAADIQRPVTPVAIRSTDLFPLGPALPVGVTHGGAAAWLINRYYTPALSDNRESGALQLALWEVVEDWNGTQTSIDLNAGNLRYLGNPSSSVITADIFSRASAMLTSWNGQQDSAIWYDAVPNENNQNPQDLIGPRIAVAPEPGTFALLALPLLSATLLRHRARHNGR